MCMSYTYMRSIIHELIGLYVAVTIPRGGNLNGAARGVCFFRIS